MTRKGGTAEGMIEKKKLVMAWSPGSIERQTRGRGTKAFRRQSNTLHLLVRHHLLTPREL